MKKLANSFRTFFSGSYCIRFLANMVFSWAAIQSFGCWTATKMVSAPADSFQLSGDCSCANMILDEHQPVIRNCSLFMMFNDVLFIHPKTWGWHTPQLFMINPQIETVYFPPPVLSRLNPRFHRYIHQKLMFTNLAKIHQLSFSAPPSFSCLNPS